MNRAVGASCHYHTEPADGFYCIYRRRPTDLVFMAAAILVTVVAVGWALFG